MQSVDALDNPIYAHGQHSNHPSSTSGIMFSLCVFIMSSGTKCCRSH